MLQLETSEDQLLRAVLALPFEFCVSAGIRRTSCRNVKRRKDVTTGNSLL